MAKGKDFYGKEVTAVIEDACREFGVSPEELDIEVLETGSAGIFGLCKKKAHIRVKRKPRETETSNRAAGQPEKPASSQKQSGRSADSPPKKENKTKSRAQKQPECPADKQNGKKSTAAEKKPLQSEKQNSLKTESIEPPDQEALDAIRQKIEKLLELMGCPSTVSLELEGLSLNCHLSSEHEELIVGTEGRTLDSLQYLLRKMISTHLPDRMMLALDAGDFRERRAEELKVRARELAEEVKETGKTQAIPALNPAERRVVHMVLQEDKAIRSRSVGDGLFKKVLIYKPGSKGGKPQSRKRRGRQGGRSSEN